METNQLWDENNNPKKWDAEIAVLRAQLTTAESNRVSKTIQTLQKANPEVNSNVSEVTAISTELTGVDSTKFSKRISIENAIKLGATTKDAKTLKDQTGLSLISKTLQRGAEVAGAVIVQPFEVKELPDGSRVPPTVIPVVRAVLDDPNVNLIM